MAPSSSLIQGSATLGISKPLAYGYFRAVGNLLFQHELTDKSIIAFVGIAEGELDGVERFWIRRNLIDTADTSIFHFHAGTEGDLGHGLAVESNGGDQHVDNLFSQIPANAYRITYSGLGYVAFKAKPDAKAPSAELDWMGDYRGVKVRIFDAAGTQTSYAFSTNPAWIILDCIIRAALKKEALKGAALTAAEKARIDFASFKAAADYFDVDIGGGKKRAEASVYFTEKTTLAVALDQLKLISRSYIVEYDGQVHLFADQVKASTFTIDRNMVVAGSFEPSKKALRQAANRFVGQYNDLNPLKNVDITTFERYSNVAKYTFSGTHPYLVGDNFVAFNMSNGANGAGKVKKQSTNYVMIDQTGADVASVAVTGSGGTAESRFTPRTKILDHEGHQQAIGQRGTGVSSTFKQNVIELPFGNNTAERVERMMKYVKFRTLGDDTIPYVAPWDIKLRCWYGSVDGAGNVLLAQVPGDVVTIDASVSEEHAGTYEIFEATTIPTGDNDDQGQVVELVLKQTIAAAFSDVADTEVTLGAVRPGNGPYSIGTIADGENWGSASPGFAQNLTPNPGFEYPAPDGSKWDVALGVFSSNNEPDAFPGNAGKKWTCKVLANAGDNTRYSGSSHLYISLPPETTIPAIGGGGPECDVYLEPIRNVKQGQRMFYRIKLNTQSNGSATAGTVRNIIIYHRLWRTDGTFFDATAGDPNNLTTNWISTLAWRNLDLAYTVPDPGAGKSWDYIQPIIVAVVTNSTGAPIVSSAAGVLIFDLRIDSIEQYRGVDPTTNELSKSGSVPPSFFNGFTYTSTTTSITPAWNITGYRTDAALTQFTANSSQLVSGLSASTSYNFYFFFDENLAGVSAVATGGTGSPSWAHVGTNRTWTAEQTRQDHIPLSLNPLAMATTSSGSGGGSGGGDGGCLREDVFVEERTRGKIQCRDLRVGDWIKCGVSDETPDGWVQVLRAEILPHSFWVHVEFTDGENGVLDWVPTTCGHPWTTTSGDRKTSGETLSLGDEIATATGITYPVSIRAERYRANKVSITVASRAHTFFCGMNRPQIETHNFQPNTN